MTVSEWADAERYLSSEASAEPGKWYTDRAPYQRGIMDSINDPSVHTIVYMASAQVGKTEIINNMAGFHIAEDPCPMLLLQPTVKMAETWSKDRLVPMVRDTPCLSDKIKIKSKDSGNSILHKSFHGGHLTMAGANSPSSLASRPIRICLFDEVDLYPGSAGDKGCPIALAMKRTTSFWNRRKILVSTPSIKGKSRIEAAYEESDKRVYHVPCPHCNVFDELKFSNLIRPHDDAKPDEWGYFCPHCGAEIEERYKMNMLRKGKWVSRAEFKGIAGFYMNEMYSPWVSWQEMIENFLQAKKLPDTLKTFINSSLAETWDEDNEGETIEADDVLGRAEIYKAQIPAQVLMLTAATDVQDDRLEVEILGWGEDKETWSIEHHVIWGDPSTKDVWQRLDDILTAEYQHEYKVSMKISVAVVDAGGHHTESVYQYTKMKQARGKKIYAVRGHSVRNQPILAKVSRNNDYKVKVFYVGTDTAKELIYSYLKIRTGAGCMHHPNTYDEAYFEQLTAERKVQSFEKGRSTTKWVCPKGKRNEALDLKVYNFAAYQILKPNMTAVKKRFLDSIEKQTLHAQDAALDNNPVKPAQKRHVAAPRRKGGFVKSW